MKAKHRDDSDLIGHEARLRRRANAQAERDERMRNQLRFAGKATVVVVNNLTPGGYHTKTTYCQVQ